MRKKIGVIGASSMIGSRFCEMVNNNFDLVKADLKGDIAIDITDQKSTENFFKNQKFDLAILFSAFTDVDAAEKQRNDKNGICWRINVNGTENIVNACQKYQKKLIFISSDFVFDGQNGPYSEQDPTGPDLGKTSWYGITKIEGEKIVTSLESFIILRIAYPYRGPYKLKEDIAKRILKLYKDNNLYPMFTDQFFTPTFVDDLAPAVTILIEKNQKGIFHLSSPNITTPFDFAARLITTFGLDPQKIEKGSIVNFQNQEGATPRAINGGLKVDKITNLGFYPTDWQEGIRKIYEQSNGQLI